MSTEEKIAAWKHKTLKWLRNPYNIMFIAILLLAFNIRLFYFLQTSNQPLWWDEADYLAFSKNVAGYDVNWIVSAQHNSLFPFLASGLLRLNFSEGMLKFFFEIIPSVFLVVMTYIILINMYKDKRIALISAFLMATFWVILFNTMRFHLGVPALLAGFLGFYTYWKGYEKKENIFVKISYKYAIPFTVFFVVLAYSLRRGYFLFGVIIFAHMLITKNYKNMFKDKYNWIGLGVFVVLILITETFIFSAGIGGVASTYYSEDQNISLAALTVFTSFFRNIENATLSPLFFLFIIGIFIMIGTALLGLGHYRKKGGYKVKADLFFLTTIVVTLANFIFVLRTFGEPRWYFPLLLGSFVAISRSSSFLMDFVKNRSSGFLTTKNAAMLFSVFIVALILGYGGYNQVKHADSIITLRADSYSGIKEAGLYLRSISEPGEGILAYPTPQIAYYSERNVFHPSDDFSKKNPTFDEFLEIIRTNPKIKYFVVSIIEDPGKNEWMKQVQYGRHPNGQTVVVAWEIPFMDTRLDFSTGEQTILEEKMYDDITFRLLDIKQDAFIYEIVRT